MIIQAAENSAGLSHMHHAQLHIGATLGLLGRKDDAVRWLIKAADEGYPSYPRFSTDASLAPLKGYPPGRGSPAPIAERLGGLEEEPVKQPSMASWPAASPNEGRTDQKFATIRNSPE